MPKSHPTSGAPEDWFSNERLAAHQLSGISFDFFIDWSATPNVLKPVIWLKRILVPPYSYADVILHLSEIIIEDYGNELLGRLLQFASSNSLQIQFIIYRDDFNWATPTSEILMVNFTEGENSTFIFTPSVVSIGVFKEIIRNNSGGAVKIGSKGLVYGTSNLECFLSGTNSLYPGDADLIILDSENKPQGILEFKKHNLTTAISEQCLSNHYPKPDGRKYNRLSILKDYLSSADNQIPILVVYYPTNPGFTEGRLELLQGKTGYLSTKSASNFTLPTNNSVEEYDKVITRLKRAITYHYSQG